MYSIADEIELIRKSIEFSKIEQFKKKNMKIPTRAHITADLKWKSPEEKKK